MPAPGFVWLGHGTIVRTAVILRGVTKHDVPVGRLHKPSDTLDRVACFDGCAFTSLVWPARSVPPAKTALPHRGENEEVEKVHATEDEQDETDLGAREFDGPLDIVRVVAVLERQCHVSDVDEIGSSTDSAEDSERRAPAAPSPVFVNHRSRIVKFVHLHNRGR